jgi:predicted O-methyltransferase YrrM
MLDEWVSRQGNGGYFGDDAQTPTAVSLFPDYAIQQHREELAEFVKVLCGLPHRRGALEIGLGYFGSTHFLWRLMFDRVVTIERSVDRCRSFCRNYAAFGDGHWCGTDGRSGFIYGLSTDSRSVAVAYELMTDPVDLVFIDGDHSYAGVLCDWLLYNSLVAPGGIVAFHDVATPDPAVSEAPRLIAEIEAGRFGRPAPSVKKIVRHPHIGIGYYVVGI